MHSALEHRRSQLQKQAAVLRECLVDYEFEPCRCAPGMSNILVSQLETIGE